MGGVLEGGLGLGNTVVGLVGVWNVMERDIR